MPSGTNSVPGSASYQYNVIRKCIYCVNLYTTRVHSHTDIRKDTQAVKHI